MVVNKSIIPIWRKQVLEFWKVRTKQEKIIFELNELTDNERLEIFNLYCDLCGSTDRNCVCWKDE